MKNKFTLEINDFAHINNAKIDIGKINVVAGENASGKSTISKFLYSIIASSCEEGNDFFEEVLTIRCSSLIDDLKQHLKIDPIFQSACKKLGDFNKNNINLDELLNQNIIADLIKIKKFAVEEIGSKNLEDNLNDIIYTIQLFFDKNSKIKQSEITYHFLRDEFGNMNKIFFEWNNSEIFFYSEDKKFQFNMKLPLKKVKINSLDNFNGSNLPIFDGNLLINDVIYIETPYILDLASNDNRQIPDFKERPLYYLNIENMNFLFHQKALLKKLHPKSHSGLFENRNMSDLLELFDLFDGNIEFNEDTNEFEYMEGNNKFQMPHTASGIKTIGILKMLINNKLDSNSLIIMDEPEVHLHPDWQLKLAKIIVLLSERRNISFYINSHSPHFIESIEAYSKAYGLENEVNFYLTEKNSSNNKFDFKKVNRENIKEIYAQLGSIFEKIDEIKGKNEGHDLLKEV